MMGKVSTIDRSHLTNFSTLKLGVALIICAKLLILIITYNNLKKAKCSEKYVIVQQFNLANVKLYKMVDKIHAEIDEDLKEQKKK